MAALGVSILLFLIYVILGLGVTAVLPRSFDADTRMRVAPGVGIGLFLIFEMAFSRAGLPVESFVYPLSGVLLLASIVAIVIRPVRLSLAQWLAYVVPVAVALAIVGSPLLQFGFHWLSYSNDDMSNYSLSAQRFMTNGYFTPPPQSVYLNNQHLDQFYWASFAVQGERMGVDMLLAAVASAFHHNPFEIFMPFILSSFMVVVVAAGAIGVRRPGSLLRGLISLTFAVSSLGEFGVLYQLLGQEFGLASLATGAALLTNPPGTEQRDYWRLPLVIAVLASALVGEYPELLPFLGFGAVLYLAVNLKRIDLRRYAITVSVATVGVMIMMNLQAITMLSLIVVRILESSTKQSVVLFPYYLIPSGFPNLWGFQPIALFHSDPLQSELIVCGIIAAAIAAYASVKLWLRGDTPAAPFLIGMLIFVVYAVHGEQGFPLYKLAMYIQPFLVPVIVSAVMLASDRLHFHGNARRAAVAVPILLLMLAGVPAESAYLNASADRRAVAAFAEVPSASRDALLDQFRHLAAQTGSELLISDASSAQLIKIEAAYFGNNKLLFPIVDLFGTYGGNKMLKYFHDPLTGPLRLRAAKLLLPRSEDFYWQLFNYAPDDGTKPARFRVDRRVRNFEREAPATFLLVSTARQTIVNRTWTQSLPGDVAVVPMSGARDHLNYINTSLGSAVGTQGNTREFESLFQLERDPFFPGSTMASIGRYFLFLVENPTSRVRLILDMTTTFNGRAADALPPAVAIGATRATFHALGDGSARLISDPVTPKMIDGQAYIGIDMGIDGSYPPDFRTGLMRMFGTDLRLDTRRLIGFGRNISAIPDGTPIPGTAPTHIASFPADLSSPAFIYSGIYEDGWLGADARFVLRNPAAGKHIVFHFMIPYVGDHNFGSSMTLAVDGKSLGTWPATLGDTTIQLPDALSPGLHDVRVHFTATQLLPAPDSRRAGAFVKSLGFE